MSFDYDFDSYEVLVPEEDVDFVGFEDVSVPVVEQLQEVVPDVGDLEGDDVSGVLCDGPPVVQGSLMAICRAFGLSRLVRIIFFPFFFKYLSYCISRLIISFIYKIEILRICPML